MSSSLSLARIRVYIIAVCLKFLFQLRLWFLNTWTPWPTHGARCPPQYRFSIPSTHDEKRWIRINVYYPPNMDYDQPQAVHINLHGSGYMFPMFGEDGPFCQLLATRLGVVVLDADYAKTPQYQFPAAYEDASDVLSYLYDSPDQFDAARITMSGFSIGGLLAFALAANFEFPRGVPPISGLVTFYPASNVTGSSRNKKVAIPPKGTTVAGLPLSHWLLKLFIDAAVRPGRENADLWDARSSPYLADLTDKQVRKTFPRNVLVVTCEYDILRDEGEAMARKVEEEVPEANVEYMMVAGVGHSWDNLDYPRGSLEQMATDNAYEKAVDALREAHVDQKLGRSRRVTGHMTNL